MSSAAARVRAAAGVVTNRIANDAKLSGVNGN
jgi:hypothetical protein